VSLMPSDYIETALHKAHYEIIDDEEPFYGEISELQGVWASGETLEVCRDNLASALEGWLLVRTARQLEISELYGKTIIVKEMSLA
jgi:predicted RNase H-like HicB family nuclease